VNQLYASIEKAKELGLVKTRVDRKKYSARNLIGATERGKSIARKVIEIIRIMK
jgi:hypothetical protein